jgi:hypothetical protein
MLDQANDRLVASTSMVAGATQTIDIYETTP